MSCTLRLPVTTNTGYWLPAHRLGCCDCGAAAKSQSSKRYPSTEQGTLNYHHVIKSGDWGASRPSSELLSLFPFPSESSHLALTSPTRILAEPFLVGARAWYDPGPCR